MSAVTETVSKLSRQVDLSAIESTACQLCLWGTVVLIVWAVVWSFILCLALIKWQSIYCGDGTVSGIKSGTLWKLFCSKVCQLRPSFLPVMSSVFLFNRI